MQKKVMFEIAPGILTIVNIYLKVAIRGTGVWNGGVNKVIKSIIY